MKRKIKIFYRVMVVLVICYVIGQIFTATKGKAIAVRKLEELARKKVSISQLNLLVPFSFEIKKLNIADLATVERMVVSPNIFYLLKGDIGLSKVVILSPEITFENAPALAKDASVPIPPAPPAGTETTQEQIRAEEQGKAQEQQAEGQVKPQTQQAEPQAQKQAQQKQPVRVVIKRLKIKNGKINFIDKAVSPQGLRITIKDIDFNLNNLRLFPAEGILNFELKARIPWQEGKEEGRINAEGWMNFSKKDMRASLKIEDIDGVYLYPYYSNWVDLEKARIAKAKLNFSSDLNSLNNDLTVKYRLELANIVFKPRPPEEEQLKAEKIAHAVLDIFKTLNKGKVVLESTFRTKMDNPAFGFGNIREAFEGKLSEGRKSDKISAEDIFSIPAKILESTVKGAADVSKALITGTISVGSEIKKAVEDSFKKEDIQPQQENSPQ